MISKELLKGILLEQRKRLQILDHELINRDELLEIKKFVGLKSALVITGIRRCGKSTLLFQIIKNFFKNDYYFVNFDDERLASFDLSDFNTLYEVCIELFGQNKTFFVDEIQNISGWERWVRRMYDNGFKFFITGSNARLLSKELATLLTGRHLQVTIFPFSFIEFLVFKNFNFKPEDIYVTERRALIIKNFSEYLKNGGFPEYLRYGRLEILQEYFSDIVQRDIVERYNIKAIKQLKELARYLITNSGNLTTYNQLKKLTQIKSVNTIINYFFYLENAYLLFKIPYFSYSLKLQSVNPFKVYATDTGLRSAISFLFSKDLGRQYETIVAIHLKRKNKEIYYWKDKQHCEVDFVIKENKVKQLIQVCYDLQDLDTRKRETNALIKASKKLTCKNLLILTENYEGEEKIEKRKIKFIPLWKWLLQ